MSIIVNRNIVFLDSLQFLKESLDTLAYQWVDSYRKFFYPRLPPKEAFYSLIDDGKRGKGNGHISDEQCSRLKIVLKESGFKNFKNFHNHYLKKMYYY